MIDTLTLQGLTLGKNTDYSLLDARGFESPGVDIAKSDLAGRHGVKVHRALWRERIIRLEFGLKSSTVSGHATLRKDFMEAFDLPRAGNTDMQIETTDGKSLELTVNMANVIDGGYKPGEVTISRIRVELIAEDPNIKGQTENQSDIAPPVAGGVELPTVIPFALATSGGSATITNGGNGIAWPTITIQGPATNAHVRNSTLGVQLNITNPLTASQSVVVDPLSQTVLLNGSTNWIQYFSGTWWWLEPGNNSIQFNSDDNDPDSYARIEWQSAYLGI